MLKNSKYWVLAPIVIPLFLEISKSNTKSADVQYKENVKIIKSGVKINVPHTKISGSFISVVDF